MFELAHRDSTCPRTHKQHDWAASGPIYLRCEACDAYMAPSTDPEPPAAVRPTWPETWMSVARTVACRSYDPRLRVGAIVVSCDNTQLLSLGYNGNYKGGPHVHESREPGKSGFIHAEVNALVKCDFNFPKPKHLYVTHSPCRDCAKLVINAEIARVVYDIPYRDTSGVDLLRQAGLEVFDLQGAVDHARCV